MSPQDNTVNELHQLKLRSPVLQLQVELWSIFPLILLHPIRPWTATSWVLEVHFKVAAKHLGKNESSFPFLYQLLLTRLDVTLKRKNKLFGTGPSCLTGNGLWMLNGDVCSKLAPS